MSRRRLKSGGLPHVRIYAHELACPAWRALSTDARALLVELRAMFTPKTGDNRVFLAHRDMQDRLGIPQRRVTAAREELVELGWVAVAERGAFTRKTRHATTYALLNLAPTGNESGASKDFMRWQPDPRFFTVAKSARDGSPVGYRRLRQPGKKGPHGSNGGYRRAESEPITVARAATQIQLPSGALLDRDALLMQSALVGIAPSVRTMLTAAWLLTGPEARA